MKRVAKEILVRKPLGPMYFKRLCILLVLPRGVVKRGFYRQNSTSEGQVSPLHPFNSTLVETERTQYLGNLQSGPAFNLYIVLQQAGPSNGVMFESPVGPRNGCS